MELNLAIDSLGVCFAVFRNTDYRIVYANKLAVDTFGISGYEDQEITAWDLFDPRSVGRGITTKIVQRDGKEIEEVSEDSSVFGDSNQASALQAGYVYLT